MLVVFTKVPIIGNKLKFDEKFWELRNSWFDYFIRIMQHTASQAIMPSFINF